MKRTDNYTVVSFRVEQELAEQLKAEAKHKYMSASAYLRKLLVYALKGENK
jgi:predicted DNA-binding protein